MYFAAKKSLLLAVGIALFTAWTLGCRQEQSEMTHEGSGEVRSDRRSATNASAFDTGGNADARSALATIPAKDVGHHTKPAGPSLLLDSTESSRKAELSESESSRTEPTAAIDGQPAGGLPQVGPSAAANRLPAGDALLESDGGNAPRILPAVGAMPVSGFEATPAAAKQTPSVSGPDANRPDDEFNPLRQAEHGDKPRSVEKSDRSENNRRPKPTNGFHSAAIGPWTTPSPETTSDRAADELSQPVAADSRNPQRLGNRQGDQGPVARLAADSSASVLRLASDAPAGDRSGKPASPKRKGKHSGEHFDPIKENGPIFEGWPKPQLALIITGREEGYIEPCGCAGLDRMKGGMARRQSLFRSLKQQGWQVVGLDVGGLARGFGKQAELKFQTMVEAKRRTGYDAVALGTTDLRLPAGELAAVAATADGTPSMFVATNVGLFGFDAGVAPRSKIIERPGARLGVMAVVGKQTQQAIHNDEIEIVDAESAIRKMLPEVKKKAGYLVLLAHMPTEEAEALARKFPEINLVATSGGPAEPAAKLTFVEGTKTILVEVGEKGMNAVVIAFFDDPKTPVRYQRVPLDARFESSTEMKALLTAYQDQLRTLGWGGLNIRALPHPQTETHGKFIGSKKCESCHEESTKVWKRTGHSRAFATLENLDPPRHHDPECVSCHVIGWHPTKYFPYDTGFVSKEKTPELIDVGCESCHGPGEKHAAAELGADLELQKRLRQAMVVTKEESAKRQCYTCHDLDNSPDFEFESYWPIVEHYED